MTKKIIYTILAVLMSSVLLYSAEEPASKPDKKTIDAYFTQAVIYEGQEKYKEAASMFEIVLWADKKHPATLLHLANCYMHDYRYGDAMKIYKAHLKKHPDDKKIKQALKDCERLSREKIPEQEVQLMPDKSLPAPVYKSPGLAFMNMYLDFLPFVCLFPLLSSVNYAQCHDYEEKFEMTYAERACFGAGTCYLTSLILITLSNNTNGGADSLQEMSIWFAYGGLGMTGLAILADPVIGAFAATNSALKFIETAKKNPMNLNTNGLLSYKEPLTAAWLSFIFPGAGYFYCGDSGEGVSNLLRGLGASAAGFGAGFAAGGGFSGSQTWLGMALGLSGSVYVLMRIVEAFNAAVYTDTINQEYYKQLLCPNSLFKIARDKTEKSPAAAFLFASTLGLVVPGAGNFYAGNFETAIVLIAERIAGGLMIGLNLNAGINEGGRQAVKYAGMFLAASSYLYDVFSAPGYTAIYNSVYTNSTNATLDSAPRLAIFPSIMPDGLGLNMACAF